MNHCSRKVLTGQHTVTLSYLILEPVSQEPMEGFTGQRPNEHNIQQEGDRERTGDNCSAHYLPFAQSQITLQHGSHQKAGQQQSSKLKQQLTLDKLARR